jgi:hypothetical protein
MFFSAKRRGAKKRIVALEGVRLDPPRPAQQSFGFEKGKRLSEEAQGREGRRA